MQSRSSYDHHSSLFPALVLVPVLVLVLVQGTSEAQCNSSNCQFILGRRVGSKCRGHYGSRHLFSTRRSSTWYPIACSPHPLPPRLPHLLQPRCPCSHQPPSAWWVWLGWHPLGAQGVACWSDSAGQPVAEALRSAYEVAVPFPIPSKAVEKCLNVWMLHRGIWRASKVLLWLCCRMESCWRLT